MANNPLRAANSNDWRPAIVDAQGNPYVGVRSAVSNDLSNTIGSGDGNPPIMEHAVDIAGLKKNVGFLNWAVAITFLSGLTALVFIYFNLSGLIDNRYERLDGKLDHIADKIGDLEGAIGVQNGYHPQTGSGTRQARPVHR
jgi:hypothetical protein